MPDAAAPLTGEVFAHRSTPDRFAEVLGVSDSTVWVRVTGHGPPVEDVLDRSQFASDYQAVEPEVAMAVAEDTVLYWLEGRSGGGTWSSDHRGAPGERTGRAIVLRAGESSGTWDQVS